MRSAFQVQMSELECTLSTKRNRIHELEEQVQRANVSSLHANEISEQLRRQILELKQANDAVLKDREERRFFTLSDLTLSEFSPLSAFAFAIFLQAPLLMLE
jgi:hypothetical protein